MPSENLEGQEKVKRWIESVKVCTNLCLLFQHVFPASIVSFHANLTRYLLPALPKIMVIFRPDYAELRMEMSA